VVGHVLDLPRFARDLAPMPMASAPANAAARPPSAIVCRSPMVVVTPARKPIVEMRPSFRPKMTSRMSRPWGVCQASLWNRLSGSASLVTGAGSGPHSLRGVDAIIRPKKRRTSFIRRNPAPVKAFLRGEAKFQLDKRRTER